MEPTDTQAPKFCINCKWVGTNSSGDWTKYKCFAPQNTSGTNLVTGAQMLLHELCEEQRKQGVAMTSYCGAEGRWFEQAPTKIVYNEVYKPPQSAKQVLKIKVGTNLLEDLGL